MRIYIIQVGLRWRGGNIYVDLCFLVLLYNSNFINQLNSLKFKDIFKNLKRRIIDCKNFSIIYQIRPVSTQRGKVGELSERKRALCWSIWIISICKCSPEGRSRGGHSTPDTPRWPAHRIPHTGAALRYGYQNTQLCTLESKWTAEFCTTLDWANFILIFKRSTIQQGLDSGSGSGFGKNI